MVGWASAHAVRMSAWAEAHPTVTCRGRLVEREMSQEVSMGVFRFEGMVLEEAPREVVPKCPHCHQVLGKLWVKAKGVGIVELQADHHLPRVRVFPRLRHVLRLGKRRVAALQDGQILPMRVYREGVGLGLRGGVRLGFGGSRPHGQRSCPSYESLLQEVGHAWQPQVRRTWGWGSCGGYAERGW